MSSLNPFKQMLLTRKKLETEVNEVKRPKVEKLNRKYLEESKNYRALLMFSRLPPKMKVKVVNNYESLDSIMLWDNHR
jgi:hypothetical protein